MLMAWWVMEVTALVRQETGDFHYALSSLWVKAHTCPLGSSKSLVLRNCSPQLYPYFPFPQLLCPVFLENNPRVTQIRLLVSDKECRSPIVTPGTSVC